MNDLYLNEQARLNLRLLEKTLPQATLFAGPEGVGLWTIATRLALAHTNEIYHIEPGYLTKNSTVKQVGITAVRELYEQLKSKSKNSRIVIIDDADKMTLAAQNAFLKLLEEPNQSTSFILTSHSQEALLPTVRSRVAQYYFAEISNAQSEKFVDTLPVRDAKKRSQMLYIATGRPAMLHNLATRNEYFSELETRISTVRNLLAQDTYDVTRAVITDTIGRDEALRVIQLIVAIISRKPITQTPLRIERLLLAYERITLGGNIKLQLARAVI